MELLFSSIGLIWYMVLCVLRGFSSSNKVSDCDKEAMTYLQSQLFWHISSVSSDKCCSPVTRTKCVNLSANNKQITISSHACGNKKLNFWQKVRAAPALSVRLQRYFLQWPRGANQKSQKTQQQDSTIANSKQHLPFYRNCLNYKGWDFYLLNPIGQIIVNNTGRCVEVHADWKLYRRSSMP